MREFTQETPPLRFTADFGEMVRTILGQTPESLRGGKPLFGRTQAFQRIGDGKIGDMHFVFQKNPNC